MRSADCTKLARPAPARLGDSFGARCFFAATLAACASPPSKPPTTGPPAPTPPAASAPAVPTVRLGDGYTTPLVIEACAWEGEPAARFVACTIRLDAASELHALGWRALDAAGQEVGHGGTAFTPWKVGDARRVSLLLAPPSAPVPAAILLEPM